MATIVLYLFAALGMITFLAIAGYVMFAACIAVIDRRKSARDIDVVRAIEEARTPYRKENERLQNRVHELTAGLRDVLKAMRTWGSWEDGIPAAGNDEFGEVGEAYDRGCVLVGEDSSWLRASRGKP